MKKDIFKEIVEESKEKEVERKIEFISPESHLIVFASDKCGVGKTFLSINFAQFLSRKYKKKRVLLVDADLTKFAHIGTQLGYDPSILKSKNISFYPRPFEWDEVVIHIDFNLMLLSTPPESQLEKYLSLPWYTVFSYIQETKKKIDFTIIDTHKGFSPLNINLFSVADVLFNIESDFSSLSSMIKREIKIIRKREIKIIRRKERVLYIPKFNENDEKYLKMMEEHIYEGRNN